MTAPPPSPSLAPPVARDELLLAEEIQGFARLLKGWIGTEMRREGMTGPMFWGLHILMAEGKASIGQLADACAVTSANASLVADDLERAGLIARTRSRSDRRVVTVEVTAKGRALHREIWAHVAERLGTLLRGVDGRDVAIAARVLHRMVEAASASEPLSEGRR